MILTIVMETLEGATHELLIYEEEDDDNTKGREAQSSPS
jgi:hypothetical protein